MIPYSYNMVDMGGIDLAEANGTVVDGLYNRIVEAVNSCGDVVLYNWKFAGIEIVPQYTSILLGAIIVINGAIQVTEQDAVTVPGINPILTTLSVTENGIYIPEPPVDGFSSVEVDIDPTLTSLSVTENGVYLPQSPAIGFSSVEVNVDQGPGLCNNNILCNWDFANIVNTRGNSSYSSGYGFDGWSVFQGTVRTSTGGINLVKASNKDFILSGQFLLQSEAVRALLGKTLTLSAMVDNEAGSVTVAITSATGVQGEVLTVGGIDFYIYRDSETQMPLYMRSLSNDLDNKVIKAVKLEFGSSQTLFRQEEGALVLNKEQTQDEEYFRVRAMVKNS